MFCFFNSLTVCSAARPPKTFSLFPYTTLFRSDHAPGVRGGAGVRRGWVGCGGHVPVLLLGAGGGQRSYVAVRGQDRKSTRLNSSHSQISYAVFCLKKKKI